MTERAADGWTWTGATLIRRYADGTTVTYWWRNGQWTSNAGDRIVTPPDDD